MANIWITYSWNDNNDNDVDYTAQELKNAGLTVKLDRWNIKAGHRLWEQIEKYITDPNQSDAWLIYATQNSLGSEPCKEEISYALDRALKSRGNPFPIIALFPSTVDDELIPACLKTRLYVSINDPDWKERIKAAAEGRSPNIGSQIIQPYLIKVYKTIAKGLVKYTVEVRPRAGTWSPFVAAIPRDENEKVKLSISRGPKDRIPQFSVLNGTGSGISKDNNWFLIFAQNEATPKQSYYLRLEEVPTKLLFGVYDGQPQYLIDPFKVTNHANGA